MINTLTDVLCVSSLLEKCKSVLCAHLLAWELQGKWILSLAQPIWFTILLMMKYLTRRKAITFQGLLQNNNYYLR